MERVAKVESLQEIIADMVDDDKTERHSARDTQEIKGNNGRQIANDE